MLKLYWVCLHKQGVSAFLFFFFWAHWGVLTWRLLLFCHTKLVTTATIPNAMAVLRFHCGGLAHQPPAGDQTHLG